MIGNRADLHITKKIALIAHEASKPELLAWVEYNRGTLSKHLLFATGATGKLRSDSAGLTIRQF